MKLYIKANSKNIIKNLDLLFPKYNTKSLELLDSTSPIEYRTNLLSANILENEKEKLFFDNRRLDLITKGIYYGNSSCEHLMPSVIDIIEVQQIIVPRKYNFVFVFPALSEFSFDKAKEILEYLNSSSCEVVVNDFGVLNLCLEYKNIKPILGTNFTKHIKKAFDNSLASTSAINHIEYEVKEVREFYKNISKINKISRISSENISFDTEFLKQSPSMYIDIYYPYLYIANSKACEIASAYDSIGGTFVNSDCHRYCINSACDFEDSKNFNIYKRYNTIYRPKIDLNLDKNIYKNKKNRLIWEIFL